MYFDLLQAKFVSNEKSKYHIHYWVSSNRCGVIVIELYQTVYISHNITSEQRVEHYYMTKGIMQSVPVS